MQWAGGEKMSHLSSRSEIEWLFAYLCSYKSSIQVTRINDRKCGRVVLSCKSCNLLRRLQDVFARPLPKTSSRRLQNVFATRLQNVLKMYLQDIFFRTTSSPGRMFAGHIPCIILSNVYFWIVRSTFPCPFNRLHSKPDVVNQMSYIYLSRRSTIGQLNVQIATAGKENLYTVE